MDQIRAIQCGDQVSVRGTPGTLDSELAGRIGRVAAKSPAVPLGQELFGRPDSDEVSGSRPVLCVHFEELNRSAWFAPHLLERVSDDTTHALFEPPTVAAAMGSAAKDIPVRQARLSSLLSRVQNFLRRCFHGSKVD